MSACMGCISFVFLLVIILGLQSYAYVPTPPLSRTMTGRGNGWNRIIKASKNARRSSPSPLKMATLGKHGENFKYLSIMKGKNSQHFPRTIPIAGMYPEVTPEDLMAPAQCPLIMPGRIAFDFSDPSGPQLGTVAVPGSDVLTFADDPVALVMHNSELGIKMIAPDGAECVAIVDRMDLRFNPDYFYAFRNPSNALEMGSVDRLEQGNCSSNVQDDR